MVMNLCFLICMNEIHIEDKWEFNQVEIKIRSEAMNDTKEKMIIIGTDK